MNLYLKIIFILCFTADGTVDSGQGSSLFSESCVSSQQTVSFTPQHEQSLPTLPASGYSVPVGQPQSQQPGGYQTSTVVSTKLSRMARSLVSCSVFLDVFGP